MNRIRDIGGMRPNRRARAVQMREAALRHAAMHRHAIFVVSLGEHFAMSRQGREQTSVVDTRLHIDIQKTVAQRLAHGGG